MENLAVRGLKTACMHICLQIAKQFMYPSKGTLPSFYFVAGLINYLSIVSVDFYIQHFESGNEAI